MAFVNIGIKGLQEAQDFLRKADVRLQKEIKAEVSFAADEIVNLIKRDAPVNNGQLKNSVSKVVSSGLKVEIIAQSNHAPYMEFGTKSKFKAPKGLDTYAGQFRGGAGSKGDPIAALTKWVRRKGIVDNYNANRGGKKKDRERQVAFAVFNKIKKYGVNPHPFFFTNKSGVDRMKQAKEIFIDRLTKALKRVTK
jgi:hypothetical protein